MKIFRKFAPFLLPALLTLPARAIPVAENEEIDAYRGESVAGQVCACTPDGGSVHYELRTEPSRGSVELREDGSFLYTSSPRSRGRDYFGYRAVDASGEVSNEAVVIIRLKPQSR